MNRNSKARLQKVEQKNDEIPNNVRHLRAEIPRISSRDSSSTSGRISEKIGQLRPSLTLALKQIALQRRADGLPVYDFGLGETKGELSETLCDAAHQAIINQDTYYTHPGGMPKVRQAVLHWLGLEDQYTIDNVVVSGGAKQCLLNTFMTICNPGDVALLAPCPWVSYAPLGHLTGVTPKVVVPSCGDDNFLKVSADDLRKEIEANPNAKFFLLNSPCNPTGQLYSEEEVNTLLNVCVENKIFFVLDRLYWRIVFDGKSFPEPRVDEETRPWLIQIDGLSKNFRRAGGLRAGWTVAPDDVAAAMTNVQSHHSSGASTVTQKITEAALLAPYDDEMVRDLENKRDIVTKLGKEIPYVKMYPTPASFYTFWDVRAAMGKVTPEGNVLSSSDDVAKYLLDCAGVVTAAGTGFFADGYLRLSFHIPESEIRGGLKAAQRAFEALC